MFKNYFIHSAVCKNFFTHPTSLENGPEFKISFIPKKHGREDAFYAQNCIKYFFI